tara:strand:+ start:286 stop:789 length:504 start_codon:yes stop_codon:yes gene_type:complete
MSEIRNQLKNQSFEAVVPSSFGVVGGRVFPDEPSVEDQLVLAQIVKTWQAAHNPTYGTPIGGSSEVQTAVGAGSAASVDVVTAVKSQVIQVQAVGITNGGGGDVVVCQVFLGGIPLGDPAAIDPSSTGRVALSYPVFVDNTTSLTFKVLSGTATDATISAATIKISQ